MSNEIIWPRLDNSRAEKLFSQLGNEEGPPIDLDLKKFDYTSIGQRFSVEDLNQMRDQLIDIAKSYGFNRRQGFDQEFELTIDNAKKLDIEYTKVFYNLAPMRWAEAGSREVWSWFALCFLPDLTHWRWKSATVRKSGIRTGEWYKPRWIGGDLSRHTWSRYWWRRVQFEEKPELLGLLKEHDLNHLLERADTIGANRLLLARFGSALVDLSEEFDENSLVSRRDIFDDSAKRMLRRMAYIDDAVLDYTEIDELVKGFIGETRLKLSACS